MDKLIINFTPTGMISTKKMSPKEFREMLYVNYGNGKYGLLN